MTAPAEVHVFPAATDDPPLFVAQMGKNKRRGKVVRRILSEFDDGERAEIAREAAEDCDFGWPRPKRGWLT